MVGETGRETEATGGKWSVGGILLATADTAPGASSCTIFQSPPFQKGAGGAAQDPKDREGFSAWGLQPKKAETLVLPMLLVLMLPTLLLSMMLPMVLLVPLVPLVLMLSMLMLSMLLPPMLLPMLLPMGVLLVLLVLVLLRATLSEGGTNHTAFRSVAKIPLWREGGM